jgi:adenylate cyclase
MKRRQSALQQSLAGSEEQLRATVGAYARFVPQEFLGAMGKASIVDVGLGDQVRLDLSILFSDIRSFTSLSEKMSPEENFAFLNSYLRRMNPFIWDNGGFIDKYIGDSIMALFPAGAGSALSAAVAMLSYLPVYNKHRAGFGYQPIGVGIGIHSGAVMLGVIGHERFMQGTVISDTVNLASRLQGLTKTYGVSLVASSHALFDLEDPNRFDFRFLDKVMLRGKEQAVSVYEVFDADNPKRRELKRSTISTQVASRKPLHSSKKLHRARRMTSLLRCIAGGAFEPSRWAQRKTSTLRPCRPLIPAPAVLQGGVEDSP